MSRTIRRAKHYLKEWWTDHWFDHRQDDELLDNWERKRWGVTTVGEARIRRRAWFHSDNCRISTTARWSYRRYFERKLRQTHRQQIIHAINVGDLEVVLHPHIRGSANWYWSW